MKNEIRAGEVCVYIPAKDIARVHITQRVIISISKRHIIVFVAAGSGAARYANHWYKLELN